MEPHALKVNGLCFNCCVKSLREPWTSDQFRTIFLQPTTTCKGKVKTCGEARSHLNPVEDSVTALMCSSPALVEPGGNIGVGFCYWEECTALSLVCTSCSHQLLPAHAYPCLSRRSRTLFQLSFRRPVDQNAAWKIQSQRGKPTDGLYGRWCQKFKLSLVVIFIM